MAVASLGLVSCDMDLKPYNAIEETEALQSITDFKNMRVGLYSGLRGITAGGYLTATELQADNFNAVVGYSNTYGDMHRWQYTPTTDTFEGVYGGYQGLIGRANFIITNQTQADTTKFEPADQVTAKKIIGEAYFMRAYCIYQLSQFFCKAYDASIANQPNTGVSYSTVYQPTSDNTKYPGRYTLEETYNQIAADLAEAKARIDVAGSPSYGYISNDVITALEARVALSKKDYATAAQKASSLIESQTYPLCADVDELASMWWMDGGTETILQIPVTSKDELPGQNGVRYLPYQDGAVPDYIPTAEVVNLFEDGDARLDIYFVMDKLTTTSGASGYAVEFNKFPDESGLWEALNKDQSARFTSEPKVFRIGEMYLIAVEAYAKMGDLASATKYLNLLKASRFYDYTETQFPSADAIFKELKNERRRELLGEGFRIFDLKRWGDDMVRGEVQNSAFCLFPGSAVTTNMKKSASDPMFVWPIPQAERDANPQIVQNPGY